MYIIISTLLLIVGIVVFFCKPQLAPFYFILWCIMGSYFVDCFILPMAEEEDFFRVYHRSYIYVFFCLIIVASRTMKSFINKNGKYVTTYMIFTIYVVILGCVRGGYVQDFIGYVRLGTMFVILWIWLRTVNIRNDYFERFVLLVLIVEISLSIMQFFEIAPLLSSASTFSDVGTINMPGTLVRYNSFAMHISLLLLCYIAIVFSNKKDKKGLLSWGIIIISIVEVFVSGAKAQLAALIISIIFLLVYNKRKKKKWMVAGCIVIAVAVFFLAKTINTSGLDEESGLERQANLARLATEDGYLSEESTVMLTYFLLEDYFSDVNNILTGSGKLYTRKEGYGGFIAIDTQNTTDAPFALFLCETGIIGLFFIVLFIRFIIKDISYKKQYAYSILLFILLTSITDMGVFDEINMFYLITIILYLNNVEKKNHAYNDNALLSNS